MAQRSPHRTEDAGGLARTRHLAHKAEKKTVGFFGTLIAKTSRDNVTLMAAGVAFYCFLSLVPLSMYFTGGRVKVELALARGRRQVDKRQAIARRDADMEARRADIHDSIARVDMGDGVVLLTDMFGGTPSNLAISMMDREGVEVLSGVNLPMLVKLAKTRSAKPLSDCVLAAQAAGRKYITAASHIMPSCKGNHCKP